MTINLLPWRKQHNRVTWLSIGLILANVIVITTMLTLVVHTMLVEQRSQLNRAIAQLLTKKHLPYSNNLSLLNHSLAQATRLLAIKRSSRTQLRQLILTLQALAQELPNTISLQKLSGTSTHLVIDGQSPDARNINQWLLRLSVQPNVSHPTLQRVTAKPTASPPITSFSIDTLLEQTNKTRPWQ